MDQKSLQERFSSVLSIEGVTLAKSASYFDPNNSQGLPATGSDVILAGEDNVVFKTSDYSGSRTVNVYYKTKDGRLISKSTLFGKHFTEKSGDFPMSQVICRTSGKEPVGHVQTLEDPVQLNVFIFDEDMPVTFSTRKASEVFLPKDKDAWNKSTKQMTMDRHPEKDYVLLTLG